MSKENCRSEEASVSEGIMSSEGIPTSELISASRDSIQAWMSAWPRSVSLGLFLRLFLRFGPFVIRQSTFLVLLSCQAFCGEPSRTPACSICGGRSAGGNDGTDQVDGGRLGLLNLFLYFGMLRIHRRGSTWRRLYRLWVQWWAQAQIASPFSRQKSFRGANRRSKKEPRSVKNG